MANWDGPAVNENPNQNPNQAQGNAQGDNQGQNPPPQNSFLPNAPLARGAPQRPQLNWSHFKPEFTVKPEDVEAHLLRMNDWMDMHDFPDNVKVQRFCSTLVGEARLWYKSLRPINAEWDDLQNMFRQQYSKIGNTREQLFHAWRSFHFDENVETIDAYVHCIRQVANLLGYQDPQFLEVFTNTLPSKLYWILFPIEDLRAVVDTAKRMLTKEKWDKQLAGQTFSTPFMNLRDSQDKKVSFNMRDDLEQKIAELMIMMDKLVTGGWWTFKTIQTSRYISPAEVEIKIEGTFMVDLETMHTGNAHHIIKILEVDIVEGILAIIPMVVRDIGIITMITEGTIREVRVMIGIEADH